MYSISLLIYILFIKYQIINTYSRPHFLLRNSDQINTTITSIVDGRFEWPNDDYCILQGGDANRCPQDFSLQQVRLSVVQSFMT